MEKQLENPGKKEKPKQPKPVHRTPPVGVKAASHSPLPLARCPVGPRCRRRFLRPRAPLPSLPRGPGSPVAEPLLRAFALSLSLRRGPPLSAPPSSRSPWTSAHALAHVVRILGHNARPRAPAPFLSLARARTHSPAPFHAVPLLLVLCPRCPTLPETRARLPGHLARRRPRQATPSSAPCSFCSIHACP
jgi:hypothetical protein